MQIKRYEVGSIQEALTKIKKDLGEDAIILSTKRLKGEKVSLLEVTAARDESVKRSISREPGDTPEGGNSSFGKSTDLTMIRKDLDEMKSLIRDFRREDPLRKELSQLKEYINNLTDVLGTWEKNLFPGPPSQIYYHLVANGVSRERAYKLVNTIDRIDSYDNTEKP